MFPNRNDFRIASDHFYQPDTPPQPGRLRRRTLFLLVFLPLLLVSEIYIFLQPAIYQSQALVLTTAASTIDQAHTDADLEHVSIQRQVLLGQSVLEKTSEALKSAQDSAPPSINELKALFQVQPVAETNLVQLAAEGSDPQFLQLALNTWIRTYQQIRAEYIVQITETATTNLNAESLRLEQQVRDKRREIENFRREHNIVSLESADNQAHARLQGLNNALNTAVEEEAKAKAKLDAIRAAVAEGRAVVPEADSRSLAILIEKAERLRQTLETQRNQYTDEYIEYHPTLRNIKQQLADLEQKIAGKEQAGTHFAAQEAENAYAGARGTVQSLQRQLAEHNQAAADFTNRFAQHQAMQDELKKLEELLQQTRQQLIEIDAKQRQTTPQLDVVDWATLPDTPLKPDYLLEAGIAFASSLLLALLTVWLSDYLNKEPNLATIDSFTEIQLYHHPEQKLESEQAAAPLGFEPLKSLQDRDEPKQLPDNPPQS